jgi:hypothetical protein
MTITDTPDPGADGKDNRASLSARPLSQKSALRPPSADKGPAVSAREKRL